MGKSKLTSGKGPNKKANSAQEGEPDCTGKEADQYRFNLEGSTDDDVNCSLDCIVNLCKH